MDATAVGTAVCVGTGLEVGVTAVGTAVCVGTGLEVGVTAVGTAVCVGTGVGVDAASVTAACCCGPPCSSPHAAKTNQTIAAAANSMAGLIFTFILIVQADTYPPFL